MKKLSLLLFVCMVSMLAFAQTDSSNKAPILPTDLVYLSPLSFDFGNVPVGHTSYATFIVRNGGAPAYIYSIAATPDPPFSVYRTDCPDPGGLYGTDSCTIVVQWLCHDAGDKQGWLTVSDNAENNPQQSYLTGHCMADDN